MNKKNKGITLIALVITIIVLLILAAISILALLGDNGIITKATKSKESTEVGTEGENVRLAVNAALTVGTGKLNTANLQEAFDNQFGDGARNNLSGDGPWEYTGKYKVYQIDLNGSFSETDIIADDIVFDVPNDYEISFVAGDNVKVYLVEYEDTQVGKLDAKDLGEVASASTLDAKNLELADTDNDTTYYEMYFIGTGEIWNSSNWYITDGENKTYLYGTHLGWCNVDDIYLKNVVSVKLSYGITNTGNFGRSDLKYIYIPSSVVSIDDYAFWRCSSLSSITIENGLTSIGNCVFRECSSLTSITIPESLISIGMWAFEGCSSLTSVTIPENVTSIGYFAFYDCTNLNEVYFEETTPPEFGDYCFRKYSGEKTTFYFKNSTVYDSLTTSYYNSSYGEKSTDFNW